MHMYPMHVLPYAHVPLTLDYPSRRLIAASNALLTLRCSPSIGSPTLSPRTCEEGISGIGDISALVKLRLPRYGRLPLALAPAAREAWVRVKVRVRVRAALALALAPAAREEWAHVRHSAGRAADSGADSSADLAAVNGAVNGAVSGAVNGAVNGARRCAMKSYVVGRATRR
jgi:hypothetical protein